MAGFDDPWLGDSEHGAGRRRNLAAEAHEGQRVAAIWLDVDIEDDVAIQIGQRRTDDCIGRQDQDPLSVVGQMKLVP